MTITATDSMCDHLLAELEEVKRLKTLTDFDLIREIATTEAIEYLQIQEVLNRWHPNWIEETGE